MDKDITDPIYEVKKGTWIDLDSIVSVSEIQHNNRYEFQPKTMMKAYYFEMRCKFCNSPIPVYEHDEEFHVGEGFKPSKDQDIFKWRDCLLTKWKDRKFYTEGM